MQGSLNYVSGKDFDARQEVWDLKSRVDVENRHRGYMSAVRLLFDLAVDGFKSGSMSGLLQPTQIENILVLEDSGVRLAFHVPGNGRYPTPDIMLLAAEFCSLVPAQRAASRASFVAMAAQRSKGKNEAWPLVRPR